MAPDDRGVINSFVTVTWGNSQKKTQIIRDTSKPEFNEEMVFKIPITNSMDNLENLLLNEVDK
jgi:hypothetical protein